MKIKFTKMHGAGNDFLILDDRAGAFPDHDAAFVARLAARRFGVGCEGVLALRLADSFTDFDYRMIFLNPDGSRAAMCGNASRCVALFAFELGVGGRCQRILADAGAITAEILEAGRGRGVVRIHATKPCARAARVEVALPGGRVAECFKVDTGVPHAVVFVPDVAAVDVVGDGRAIRNASAFSPAGTNADFVEALPSGGARMRTYERGVEAETLACGTGIVAAALVAEKLGLVRTPVRVRTAGGDELEVGLAPLTLTGPAEHSFRGTIDYR